MFEYLYGWLRNISYYLILMTAVTYILPSNSYRKYIRFFTGLVLILMLITPVMNLFGINLKVEDISEYEKNLPDFVERIEEFDHRNCTDQENIYHQEIQIEVEDVVIGP